MSVLLNFTSVSAVKESLTVDGVDSRLIVFEISHHNMPSAHADFAFAVLVGVVDLERGSWHRKTSGIKSEVAVRLHCSCTGSFTHAVHVEQRHVQRGKVVN